MIDMGSEHHPAHLHAEITNRPPYFLSYAIDLILLDEQNGKFIFGLENISTSLFIRLLASFMVLNVWRSNVGYIEQRLEYYRHEAIVHPSLDTFQPLTTLRMNIADLERAIIDARKESRSSFADLMHAFDKKHNTQAKLPEVAYESLLQRVRAMSTLLNNEIQLIIGSVTVQVHNTLSEASELS